MSGYNPSRMIGSTVAFIGLVIFVLSIVGLAAFGAYSMIFGLRG